MATEWFLPLHVLVLTGYSFALAACVWFNRQMQLSISVIAGAFVIPLLSAVLSFVFRQGLPAAHSIALGEAVMTLLLLGLFLMRRLTVRTESALFLSLLTATGLCLMLGSLEQLPFLYQDLRVYLTAGFLLSVTLVILTRGTELGHQVSGFAILGVSQLMAIFQGYPLAGAVSLFLKVWFFSQLTRQLFQAVHQEMMKEVGEARRIQKEFDDTLRKEVKKQVFYMEMSQQKLAKISQTDALTEAYNRKGILDQLDRLVDDRNVTQFSMLIFDIDRFKNINDTLGHPVGDKCIRTLAHIARANLREGDSLGRYGGDEFIILLPGADTETAFRVAERFRQRVQETADPHFTISIGYATYPYDGRTGKDLLSFADQGLYLAKERGKNRAARREPAKA